MGASSADESQAGDRARREARWFVGAVVGLWLLFLVQAWLTPTLLDDWYQLPWQRTRGLGLTSIWDYGHYNYFHFNPRLGDVLLLVINGPRALHLVLSPLVQLGLLGLAFAIAFGRWPRRSLRDLQLLLILQVLIWLISPIPGVIYFYRPFATNYLWAFATTLALLVPYRLALAQPAPPRRLWLMPILLVVGWCAGMSNEHTGPTAILAVVMFTIWAWRTGRLRAWMLAGAAGVMVGYPMLILAPGQALRYAGVANRSTPLSLLAERGLDGCFEILLDFVGEAQLGILLVLVGLLVYLAALRRRGADIPSPTRTTLVTITLLIVAAGGIVVTLFASPTASERLFFASSVLLAGALAVIAERLLVERAARRMLAITCAVIFGYHAVQFVRVYVAVKAENDARIALLRAGPRDTVVVVPPYKHRARTRWHWGDDFRYASLREYVGNEVFDLNGIELGPHPAWAQPAPPDRYVATRTFDPPLAADAAATLAPVRYIPTYWEWALVQLRKLRALGPLDQVPGHRLVRYTVESVGLGFVDPVHRPLRVLDWTPTTLRFVDGQPFEDDLGDLYIRVWRASVPPQLAEAYVVGCGRTDRVPLVPDPEARGVLIPIAGDCAEISTGVMCEPEVCWIAGRAWR